MTTPKHLRTFLLGAATCAAAGLAFYACSTTTGGNANLATGDAAGKVYVAPGKYD